MNVKGVSISLGIIIALLFSLPCYADGGIPLWVMSAPTLFAFGIPNGIMSTLFTFFLSLNLLLFVSLIETIIVRLFLKNSKFEKMFSIVYKANFVSTLLGFLVVIAPVPFNIKILNSPLEWGILGPWGPLLLVLNIILLVVSYFVEYKIAKKYLITDYSIKDIKKSFLFANITTYFIPILLYSICFIFLISSTNINELNNIIKNSINEYIEDIEIVKPAFLPRPLLKKECEVNLKQLGLKTKCNMENNYWAGAVVACKGTENMFSDYELTEIAKKIYHTNNVDSKDLEYDYEVARKYGFPDINLNNGSYLHIWTNHKPDQTSYAHVYSFGKNSSSYFIPGQGFDSFYAICINKKTNK